MMDLDCWIAQYW